MEEEEGEGEDKESDINANVDDEETVSMLKRGTLVADPLTRKLGSVFSQIFG